MPKLNNLRFKRIPACELMPGEMADFFKSPTATVDWLAHLSEKEWFEAKDFLAMMHRFREATGAYGGG